MQLMTVGSKWELVLPPELGYGNSGKQGIPAQSVMVFTLEILSCEGVPLGDPELDRVQAAEKVQLTRMHHATSVSLKNRLQAAGFICVLIIGSICTAALCLRKRRVLVR